MPIFFQSSRVPNKCVMNESLIIQGLPWFTQPSPPTVDNPEPPTQRGKGDYGVIPVTESIDFYTMVAQAPVSSWCYGPWWARPW